MSDTAAVVDAVGSYSMIHSIVTRIDFCGTGKDYMFV